MTRHPGRIVDPFLPCTNARPAEVLCLSRVVHCEARKRGAGQAVYAVMQKRSINLTFHGIGEPPRALDPGEENVWVAHDRFVALLDSVVGRDDVRITFDDGNASDVEHALPALVDRELDATFFVVAGRLGEPTFVDAGRRPRAGRAPEWESAATACGIALGEA